MPRRSGAVCNLPPDFSRGIFVDKISDPFVDACRWSGVAAAPVVPLLWVNASLGEGICPPAVTAAGLIVAGCAIVTLAFALAMVFCAGFFDLCGVVVDPVDTLLGFADLHGFLHCCSGRGDSLPFVTYIIGPMGLKVKSENTYFLFFLKTARKPAMVAELYNTYYIARGLL